MKCIYCFGTGKRYKSPGSERRTIICQECDGTGENIKEKAKNLWDKACRLIKEWEKITKRDFNEDYQNMERGD